MVNLSGMTTEARNNKTMNLDSMNSLQIASIMNEEDSNIATAIKEVLPQVAKAIDKTSEAFMNGGRLIYLGAGTSGRLGLLDAVECPPTFGVPDNMVIGLIAGGESAFIKAVEGAEDSDKLCAEDLKALNLQSKDMVIGIAASGRTPYVIGGLNYAKKVGCNTAAIACNKNTKVGAAADIAIEITVGPEVLTGSTRLKAGTAQKMILNMISTASMVKVGKVYKNLMVDVMQTNEKLQVRAKNIVMTATGVDDNTAKDAIVAANGCVKEAIVMILLDCTNKEAKAKLEQSKGHIKDAIK